MDKLTLADIQSQLEVHGIHGFQATRVSLHNRDLRRFLEGRVRLFERKQPDTAILRSVYPALSRLKAFPLEESIFRWEAESEIGKIVGYSVRQRVVFVFHWIQKDRDWVASVIVV